MQTSALQLLPTTTYGTPSGNYDGSSQDWSGDRQKAAAYYGGFGDLQTLAFYLLGFTGTIQIQATLDSDPTQDSQWFSVYEYVADAVTDNFSRNITGNFTWIRANVQDFTAGTITKVVCSY